MNWGVTMSSYCSWKKEEGNAQETRIRALKNHKEKKRIIEQDQTGEQGSHER